MTSEADSSNHCFTSSETVTVIAFHSLHIHNAQTPEQASDANLEVWVSIHPTDSVSATASEAITISYTTGASADTATAGSDYTAAPANSTVTIPAGASYASFDIPILADSDDEGNETFTVSLTDATTTDSKVISIADSSATATIGDPDISSIYFYPNRPLMQGDGTTTNKGDRVYFDCYVQAPSGSPFGLNSTLLSIDNSTFVSSGGPLHTLQLLSHSLVDLRNYSATGTPLLATSGLTRVVDRYTIHNSGTVTYPTGVYQGDHTYRGYQPADASAEYRCGGQFANGNFSTPVSGSFGQKAYGQAY